MSTFGASLVSDPFLFYFLFGVVFGIGAGLLSSTCLYAGWSHLPDRKALVIGVVMSGYGLGAFFSGIAATLMINPLNEPSFIEEQMHNSFDR
jgi:MFS family permease